MTISKARMGLPRNATFGDNLHCGFDHTIGDGVAMNGL